MQRGRFWLTLGAILGGLGVAAGAFGAHGLEDHFAKMYEGQVRKVAWGEIPAAEKYLHDFATAAEYQMIHALALVAVGLLAGIKPQRTLCLNAAGTCFLLGILMFSGCLYAWTLTGQKLLIIPIPIGGTFYIIGWGLLAFAGSRCSGTSQS